MILNAEMAYINWYLSEKEYHLTHHVRKALDTIDWLIRKKRKPKALAIHIVNQKYKSEYKFEFSKKYLWRCYNQRKAYIKNAKDKFKIWRHEKILESTPDVMKAELCACGCRRPVQNGNKYINGHNPRFKSKAEKINYTTEMRKIRRQIKLDKDSSIGSIGYGGAKYK